MCQHQPPCPPADASDREAAHVAASHPGQSARSLMQHLATDATGETWNVNTSRPEE